MIPDDVIEQVREAADLVGIIGESVELKRTGADYRGRCPFHGGTHRNFAVIPKKGMFYCFVCHEAGDVFTFFMKRLGMDYPTAVREVARRVGITIPDRSGPTVPDPREPLFAAVATAADWFARQLRESTEGHIARRYLEWRHVTMEQAQVQGLGFAPRGTAFLDAMKGLGVREEVLLEAGLLVKREDGSKIPRFRGRLLFPIHDLRSRVVAFSGRVLGDGEPTYLNSPETPIFQKGQLRYDLHLAKHEMRKAERALALEQALKDCVDVLERKIQILERKGFFGSLPGRRRALDRLLPTIRAAADPISRDLYISRVAEVAGVRKDVLEREVDGARSAEHGAVRSPVLPAPSSVLHSSAEKSLLSLMMAGEPWRSQVVG